MQQYGQLATQKYCFENPFFWHYCLNTAVFSQSPHSIRAQSSLQAARAWLMTSQTWWASREGRGLHGCSMQGTSPLLPYPFSQMWTPPSHPSSLFLLLNLSAPFCMQRERNMKRHKNLFIEHQIDSVQTIICLTVIRWIKGNIMLLFSVLKGPLFHTYFTSKSWILSVRLRACWNKNAKKELKRIRRHIWLHGPPGFMLLQE